MIFPRFSKDVLEPFYKTVYRSSGVGVVDFDESLLAPLMLKSRGEIFFQRVKHHSYFGVKHRENSEDSSNCCIFEMKHSTGMETGTKIYFLFIFKYK